MPANDTSKNVYNQLSNAKSSLNSYESGIAIIGCGYWGKNLIRNFNQLGVLKLICDKNEVLLDQFKNQYPGIDTCLALGDILSRDDIQGVVIATPAETHYPLAREVLLTGKHVFVEKPFVLREEEAEDLQDLARQHNQILMVGHVLQYHPVFMRLKELVISGELGRINYIYTHRLNLGKIRREENILWSFAPHDISMILSLVGEEPESVMAMGGYYLHQKIADVTTTYLEFQSGLRAHIFVSWLHPFKEQKLVVVGDQMMAVFDDTQPWPDKLLLYPHKIKWRNNIPFPAKSEPERLEITEKEPLRLECENFLSCISRGQMPITDGLEGLRVQRILNASQRSLDDSGSRIYIRVKERKLRVSSSPESLSSSGNNHLPLRTSDSPQQYDYFVHDTAIIDDNVTIGSGTKIWHFSHILSDSRIGKNCNIGQNVVIDRDVIIGNGCKIQNNVSIYKGVTLEDAVFCGPSMVFTNVYNPRAEIKKMDQARQTLVKKGATIGANATIICGITIGGYAFIGAGSVVTTDVRNYALVVGNPARQIGWVCRCGEGLTDDLECTFCGKKYLIIGDVIKEEGGQG